MFQPLEEIVRIDLFSWYNGAFCVGAVIIFLFSVEKFDNPYPGNDHLSEVLPSSLSLRTAYIKAFSIYFAALILAYTVGCGILSTASNVWIVVFGKEAAQFLDGVTKTPNSRIDLSASPAVPLAVALLMVGLLPQSRNFANVEAPLRRFSHRLIGVPGGLFKLAGKIAGAPLQDRFHLTDPDGRRVKILRLFLARQLAEAPDWIEERFLAKVGLPSHLPQSALASADRNDLPPDQQEILETFESEAEGGLRIAIKWYRARVLVMQFDEAPAAKRLLESGVMHRYVALRKTIFERHDHLKAIVTRVAEDEKQLADLIDALMMARTAVPAEAGAVFDAADLKRIEEFLGRLLEKRRNELSGIEGQLDLLLEKIHLYIAAAVILDRQSRDEVEAVAKFGLSFECGRSDQDSTVNIALMSVFSMVVIVFLSNVALVSIPDFAFSGKAPVSLNGAADTETRGSATLSALRLALSALVLHGGAVLLAFTWRQRRIENENYSQGFTGGKFPVQRYLGISALIFTLSYVGLLLWQFSILTLYDQANLKLDSLSYSAFIFFALSAVVSGISATIALEIAVRTRRSVQAAARLAVVQGTVTAIVLYFGVDIQLQGDPQYGFILKTMINGFVIGATLGATILLFASQLEDVSVNSRAVATRPS